MITNVGSGNLGDEPGQPTLLSVAAVAPMMGLDLVELK